jgi:hypothetical protein
VNGVAPGVLWTAMPLELVMDGMDQSQAPAHTMEMSVGDGLMLQVVPGADGMGTVQRLISGNTQDYLDPRWQPGARVALSR